MKTIELVIFKFKEGTTRHEESRYLEVTDMLVRSYKGFIDRMYMQDERGNRADLIRWETMADAQTAAEEIMKNSAALEVFEKIDTACMKFYHFTPVHESKMEG